MVFSIINIKIVVFYVCSHDVTNYAIYVYLVSKNLFTFLSLSLTLYIKRSLPVSRTPTNLFVASVRGKMHL